MNSSKHHVHTSLGACKKCYSNEDSPIYGSGQGTGSAGMEWAFISIPLIKVIEYITTGFTTTNIDNKKSWSISVTRFDNDKRLFSSIPRHLPQHILTALTYLQQISQYWEYLLYSSGGKLNYGKCLFYVISWIFHDNGATTMDTKASYTFRITFNSTGIHTEIKHLYKCTNYISRIHLSVK